MLICPIHHKELKHFEGIGKTSGKPYSNDKCTHKDDKGFCNYVIWAEDKEIFTKKFTQNPENPKEVMETSELWPVEGDLRPQTATETQLLSENPVSDVRSLLNEILDKVTAIRKFQLGDHE